MDAEPARHPRPVAITIVMMKSAPERNKHQIKSEATRAALLQAAEQIFARDGFERAQIDEIGKASGRTRGAVYAQFKTKEQLFFALQEQQAEQGKQGFLGLAKQKHAEDEASRLTALREFFSHETQTEAAILDLEMKLYALRHPETADEWRRRNRRLYPKKEISKYFGVENESGRSKVEHRMLALGALRSGLMLAMALQPDVLSRREVELLLGEVFDGLFPEKQVAPPRKAARKKAK